MELTKNFLMLKKMNKNIFYKNANKIIKEPMDQELISICEALIKD